MTWLLLGLALVSAPLPLRADDYDDDSLERALQQARQAEPAAADGVLSAKVRELQQTINDQLKTRQPYTAAELEAMGADEKELLGDMNPEVKFVTNPVVEKVMKAMGKRRTETFVESAVLAIQLRRFLMRSSVRAIQVVWGLSGLFVLYGAGGFLSGQRGWSKDAAWFAYHLSRHYLGAVAVAAPLALFLARVNLWALLPPSLWALPAANVGVGALFLWILDDFDIVKGLLSGAKLPALSMGLVLIGGAFLAR